jgi:hypothetical protein
MYVHIPEHTIAHVIGFSFVLKSYMFYSTFNNPNALNRQLQMIGIQTEESTKVIDTEIVISTYILSRNIASS